LPVGWRKSFFATTAASVLHMEVRRSFRRTRTGSITSSSTSNFHGNNGAGLGASHETGWTGAIARVLDLFARITPEATLEGAQKYMAVTREQVAGVQLAKWLERGLTSADSNAASRFLSRITREGTFLNAGRIDRRSPGESDRIGSEVASHVSRISKVRARWIRRFA
jgi:hypothetical protein